MRMEYFLGFNHALAGIYKNPFNDKKDADKFIEYHNGHNSGTWHLREKNSFVNNPSYITL